MRGDMLSLVLIGLSLSMDACTVSISSGISIRGLRKFYMGRASFFFGLFQFLMPIAGYYLGKFFISYIETVDHWIAFALLALIGGKMLFEGISKKRDTQEDDTTEEKTDIRNMKVLLILALATSIDALAVGISLSIMDQNIWFSAALIGGITFVICMLGFEFGRWIGLTLERGAEIAAGIILIGIGVKILLEHLLLQ
jgi:putative Mn2+ efflux pump MntP